MCALSPALKIRLSNLPSVDIGKYVAIDCEMVGIGPNPRDDSALVRVSLVNYNGEQVYDSFVLPREPVTDWRTHISGITEDHMADARSFEEVQKSVSEIIDGKILVGHAIRNDFNALLLSHPKKDVRDTCAHPPFRSLAGGGSPSLKYLASVVLGIQIQQGAHSSIQDSRATMMIFRKEKDAFEREHSKKWASSTPQIQKSQKGTSKRKTKKKKKG